VERCRKSLENCPARLSKEGCKIIMHHLFYPKSKYEEAGEVPAEFRELQINRVPMCKGREMILHRDQPEGPPMPTMEVMEAVVEMQRERRDLAARPLRRP
jgi:hypothetical protein